MQSSTDVFLGRPDSTIVVEAIIGWIPHWMVVLFLNMPSRRLQRLHNYMKVALGVAREVVDRQSAVHASGKEGSKDIMSILGIYYPNMMRIP
jgi:hypothetical protein